MHKSVCQGRTSLGRACGNSAAQSERYCHQHRYQSATFQSGGGRVINPQPPVSVQGSLFDFDDIDAHSPAPAAITTSSPRGYDGKPDTMPRYAIFRGNKVRVISYDDDNRFTVLDTSDNYRSVRRGDMTFLPDKPRVAQPRII